MTTTWNPMATNYTTAATKMYMNSVYGLTNYTNYGSGSHTYIDDYVRNDVATINEVAQKLNKHKTKHDFIDKMAIKKIIFADNKNKTILFTSDCAYQRKTIVTKSPNETAFVNDADLIRFSYVKSMVPKSTWEVISEIPIPEDEESQHRLVKKIEKAFLSRSRYLSLERELKYIFFEMPAKKRKSVIVYQNCKNYTLNRK